MINRPYNRLKKIKNNCLRLNNNLYPKTSYALNIATKIDQLIKAGIVTRLIGKTKSPMRPGIVLWAHKPPGDGFDIIIKTSDYLSGKKPMIVVDNILPLVVFHRNTKEQNKVNRIYSSFFKARGCHFLFLSEIFQQCKFESGLLNSYLKFSDRISLNDFYQTLPEAKSLRVDKLSALELLHLVNQLFTYHTLCQKNMVDTLFIPCFNQATFLLHRNISPSPMSAIVTPVFGNNEIIERKLSLLQELLINIEY